MKERDETLDCQNVKVNCGETLEHIEVIIESVHRMCVCMLSKLGVYGCLDQACLISVLPRESLFVCLICTSFHLHVLSMQKGSGLG